MAVSAVESRIIELIRKNNKKLYFSNFSKATLGQLINLFDEHQYTDKKYNKIKKLLSDKHKPLLTLLNQYRIYSVHPKQIKITPQIAESILNLSFCFMLDKTLCPYSNDIIKCKSHKSKKT